MNNMNLIEGKLAYNDNELMYKYNSYDQSINNFTITFNKYLHSKTNILKPGQVSISFKNENDIPRLIDLFRQEVSKQKLISQNAKFVFVIIINNKEQEERKAKEIATALGINYEFVYKQELIKSARGLSPEEMLKQQQLQEEMLKQQENQSKNSIARGTNQITTEDKNGNIKKYIEVDDKIYEDNDKFSIAEEKAALFNKWLADPVKSAEIAMLSPERLDEKLTASVTMNKKTHYLNPASNLTAEDNLANISNNIAHEHDGKVNTELGIIENSANMENEYTVVEETKTNSFNIVSPTTTEQTIKGNKSSSSISGNTSGEYTYNTSFEEENINEREFENIYYIDDYSNEIYNSKGELIGTLGQQSGYSIDVNNNLMKDGQRIGTVDNIKAMQQTQTKSNVRKRVLEKPNGYVSFMLISLGLSLILLIYIILSLI